MKGGIFSVKKLTLIASLLNINFLTCQLISVVLLAYQRIFRTSVTGALITLFYVDGP